MKSDFQPVAMMRARVVFPMPGGPQKMRFTGSFFSTILFRILSGPIRWDWPMTSESFSGLSFSARGMRFMVTLCHDLECLGRVIVRAGMMASEEMTAK